MASIAGPRIAEIKVKHHARQFGKSKYGLSRIYKVLLDLMVIKTVASFTSRPLQWFTLLALPFALAGTIVISYAVWSWAMASGRLPLPIAGTGIILLMAAVILACAGALGELVYKLGDMREHHFSRLSGTVWGPGSMDDRRAEIELTVIVPVGARTAAAVPLHAEYKAGLDSLDRTYELIYVLDGAHEEFAAGLRSLLAEGERFTVVSLNRQFGEATALMAGFEHAAGKTIITLPAYHQIVPTDVARLVAELDSSDMAIGRRWPRAGGLIERFRRNLFHGLLALGHSTQVSRPGLRRPRIRSASPRGNPAIR